MWPGNDIYSVVLQSVGRPNGSLELLIAPDSSERSLTLKVRDIPKPLLAAVTPRRRQRRHLHRCSRARGRPIRYNDGEHINYAIGVRLDEANVTYFEVLRLDGVEATLNSLRLILIATAAVASIAGAGLGYYSARGALKPLAETSKQPTRSPPATSPPSSTCRQTGTSKCSPTRSTRWSARSATGIERERRFTSDVAHELRSPLMTLTASVEILERRQESLPTVAQQAVELLSQDLRRFQQLVEDLLEVSRMEAGAVQLQLSRFRLSEFLENVIYQSAEPRTWSSGTTTRTASSRSPPTSVDLAQVLTNLIDNAEKYGNGADAVWFDVVGDNVQIVVADSGPGVPAHQRERIFERFGRADAGKRGSESGFGLGLSLVAEHVRLHGGQVWVTDRIDGEQGRASWSSSRSVSTSTCWRRWRSEPDRGTAPVDRAGLCARGGRLLDRCRRRSQAGRRRAGGPAEPDDHDGGDDRA